MKNISIGFLLASYIISGCTVRRQNDVPREGVTVTTEHVTNSPIDSYKKVTYAKNSQPFKELGYFDNGDRLYEAYYARKDTLRFTTLIQYFRSGDLASVSITDGNRLITRYSYYPDGEIQSRYNGYTGVEENWNNDGKLQKLIEYDGKNPKRVTQWHANGTMSELSEWHNEHRNGKWFQWDTLGNQTRKEMYAMGKLKK